jgi:hypothetical protein
MVQFAARLSDDGTRGRRRTLSDTFMASHSEWARINAVGGGFDQSF